MKGQLPGILTVQDNLDIGPCKKMYFAMRRICDKVFDADFGNGFCIS